MRNPTPSSLLDILSPLLEARNSADLDNPLLCQSILDPLCPTEHSGFYATARRRELSMNIVKERALAANYQGVWAMVLELVILLEDTRR